MSPILQLRGVSKSFGPADAPVAVLRDVDLTVMPGEKVSVIGPSGCGKSTLLALVAGLLRPDSGTVEIDGVAISELDESGRARLRAQRIGIALQSDNLIPFLSATENVELALAFGGRTSRAAARGRAEFLLEQFGVAHRADHLPRQVSGGEAQRIALAVALASDPALLLADEIVASLDAETAVSVIGEVLEREFAMLYVAHQHEIADLADHRYALADHAIVPR